MGEMDDQELDATLREERREAREEFVQSLAADVRGRRSTVRRTRPRLALALALSLSLVTTAVAFGGAGAASNALHSSADSVRSAVEHKPKPKRTKSVTPAAKQYSAKVAICYPEYRWTIKYKWITKYKWVWKTKTKNGGKSTHRVRVPYIVKVKFKVKTITYSSKLVSAKQVPRLVAKGAIYPVPVGGCPRTARS